METWHRRHETGSRAARSLSKRHSERKEENTATEDFENHTLTPLPPPFPCQGKARPNKRTAEVT